MKLKTIVQLALLALLIALIGCGGGHVAGNPGAGETVTTSGSTSGSTAGATAGETSGSTSGTTA